MTVNDAIVVIFSVCLAQWIRLDYLDCLDPFDAVSRSILDDSLVSVTFIVGWFTALAGFRTRSPRVIGVGYDEYQRVASATFAFFGVFAIIALVARQEIVRGYFAMALPVGLVGLLFSRWVWRTLIVRKRNRGEFQTSVLVVGGADAVRRTAHAFAHRHCEGYRVVGVCVPEYVGGPGDVIEVDGREITIYGDEHSVVEAVQLSQADTVMVTATETLGSEGIHDLVWQLDSLDTDLVVATGVVDVTGWRLAIRPVAGLSLIHVERPSHRSAKCNGKRLFDLAFAVAALLVLAPVFAVVALLIKLDSKGPMFYKVGRIGMDGAPFEIIKFRSIDVDADKMVGELGVQHEGAGPLCTMGEDPRVTRVGRVLRRVGIDELPQFLNVIRGEMSVVGPRPLLRREVKTEGGQVTNRLLVRPGVTGLWQVSGRSDLSWDELVRLDLSYVENWSVVSDVLIVCRAVKAVIGSGGAD
nr:sugar transferase [Rhodococcus rhodochrous]